MTPEERRRTMRRIGIDDGSEACESIFFPWRIEAGGCRSRRGTSHRWGPNIGREESFDIECGERVRVWTKLEFARECPRCEKYVVIGRPDPCLGYLPGVFGACCGHGEETGYIAFTDGPNLQFSDLVVYE